MGERHEVNNPLQFVLAGNSSFTLQNSVSGNRITYKVTDVKRVDEDAKKDGKMLWFVKVLTGSNNEADYTFTGTIQYKDGVYFYKHSNKSRITTEAPAVKGISWLLGKLQSAAGLPDHFHVYHEGRCGRCGRKLTVPESIISGYGPECAMIGGF